MSLAEEIWRQLGLTGRALAQGGAGLFAAGANPLAWTANQGLEAVGADYRFPEQNAAVADLLTKLGFPEPEGTTEKAVGFVGELGIPDPTDAARVTAQISHMIDPQMVDPLTAIFLGAIGKGNLEKAGGEAVSDVPVQPGRGDMDQQARVEVEAQGGTPAERRLRREDLQRENYTPPDLRPRWELDDSGATIREDRLPKVQQEHRVSTAPEGAQVPLSDVLDHPRLFEAYPQLKDWKVQWLAKDERPGTLGATRHGDKVIMLNRSRPIDEQLDTMIHELQHVGQRVEGHSRGGGVKPEVDEASARFSSDLANRIEDLVEQGKVPEDMVKRYGLEDRWGINDFADKFAYNHYYQRLYGEIEARNAADRRLMTPDERRAIAPSETMRASDIATMLPPKLQEVFGPAVRAAEDSVGDVRDLWRHNPSPVGGEASELRWDQLPMGISSGAQARDFAMIAAEPAQMGALKADLEKLVGPGKVHEMKGRYGGADEDSFLVDGLDLDQYEALYELGRKYKQESILTPRGLIYTTGENAGKFSPLKSLVPKELGDDVADNFSEIAVRTLHGDPVTKRFTYDIDWDTLMPVPSRGQIAEYLKSSPGQHVSPRQGLTELDPSKAGSGADRMRYSQGRAPERNWFYVPEDAGKRVVPEPTVQGAGRYKAELENLYPVDEDPAGLRQFSLNEEDLYRVLQGLGAGGVISKHLADPRFNRAGSAFTFGSQPVEDVDFSRILRLGPDEPFESAVEAYKLFRKRGDELFPLFVNANEPVPVNQWLQALSGPRAPTGQVRSKIGNLAYRPGWHAGDLPIATHIGGKSDPSLKAPDYRPDDQVWARVQMAADKDWQAVADANMQYSKAGNPILRTAHVTDQVPYGGFYRYKTNPNMTGEWLIGGDMRVLGELSDAEVRAVNEAAGVSDLPRLDELELSALLGLDEAPDLVRQKADEMTRLAREEPMPESDSPLFQAMMRDRPTYAPAQDSKSGRWFPGRQAPESQAQLTADIKAAREQVAGMPSIFDELYPQPRMGERLQFTEPARGRPEWIERDLSAENVAGLQRLMGIGQQSDGHKWFYLGQPYDIAAREFGEDQARTFLDRLGAFAGATTSDATPAQNLGMASWQMFRNAQGLGPEVVAPPYPFGHARYKGFKDPLTRLLESNFLDPAVNPKGAQFAGNISGRSQGPTFDKVMSNVTPLMNAGGTKVLDAPHKNTYGYVADWFEDQVARPAGLLGDEGQAATWVGQQAVQRGPGYSGHQPFQDTISQAVQTTALLTGRDPMEIYLEFVMGKTPLIPGPK